MSVYQRTSGVARIDCCVGLNELTRFARVVGKRIWTIQRAHNTARDRKAKPEWIAEREHRLSWVQCRGISPRNAGQTSAIYFDHSQIRQWIGANQFGFKDFAVAHGDADVDRAVDYVVVGDDVSIGGNDDAAADAMLNLRLPAHSTGSPGSKDGAEELLHVVGQLIVGPVTGSVGFVFRGNRDIDDCRRNSRGQSFHRL